MAVSRHYIYRAHIVAAVVIMVVRYRIIAVVVIVLKHDENPRPQNLLQSVEPVVVPAVRIVAVIRTPGRERREALIQQHYLLYLPRG